MCSASRSFVPGELSRIVAFPADCGLGGSLCPSRWYADVPTSGPGSPSPAIGAGAVYVTAGRELRAYAVGCGTGGVPCEPLWVSRVSALTPALPSNAFLGSPTVANGLVYTGDTGGRVWAFSAACGPDRCGPQWSVPLDSDTAAARPVITDGRLYAVGNGTYEFELDGIRPVGALWQPPGAVGCRSRFGHEGCGRTRRLGRVYDVTVSPDGRFAYAATWIGGALVAFARDPQTGALTQLRGRAGCTATREPGRGGCARAHALGWPVELELSPDGRHLYAASAFNVISSFRRDRHRGTLTQLPGPSGCIGPRTGCRSLRAISGHGYAAAIGDLNFDPAGRHLYLSGPDATIRVLARDRRTGALREPRSRGSCLAGKFAERPAARVCRRTSGFGGNFYVSLALSHDGRHLYVGSDPGSLVLFRRDPRSGMLRRARGPGSCIAYPEDHVGPCLRPPPAGPGVAISRWATATECYTRRTGTALPRCACVCIAGRPERGRFARLREGPVASAKAIPWSAGAGRPLRGAPVLAPGGDAAYAIGEDGELLVYRVGRRGELLPLLGEWACLGPLPTPETLPSRRCVAGRGLRNPGRMAFSPDGRHLYVSAFGNSVAVLEPRVR